MAQQGAACSCRQQTGCRFIVLLLATAMALASPREAAARTQDENFPVQPGSTLQYQHVLRYPARALPAKACACRVDINNRVQPRSCPEPWNSPAGTTKIPAPLKVSKEGDLVEETTGRKAKLHGINWFGYETGSGNMDGLWAYDDDEIPATSTVSQASLDKMQIKWWGKRTMTNDFAHVVHRIKSLGFNAVRVPFNFSNLQMDVPPPKLDPTEFYTCVRDPIDYINLEKTLDPKLSRVSRGSLAPFAPKYTGMQHPPPVRAEDGEVCRRPWEAPFAPRQTVPKQYGDKLQLTMCNWYLPQGPHVQQVHRFLWQIQYLVAQGLYVLLDHASYLERDPNMANPGLFAANWGNLWRMVTELPEYSQRLRGRVFPDLANEPSRWGCQWERNCLDNQGLLACAPGARLYHGAMKAIHNLDNTVPVFANPMGQAGVDAGKFPNCARSYQGMNFGEGSITDKTVLQQSGISDPSVFFKDIPAMSRGKVVLTPHVYPGTLSGWGEATQVPSKLFPRMDLSYGLKALGKDNTSDGQPLRRLPVVVGEFGVFDHGSYSQAPDFTDIARADVAFLRDFSTYLQQKESQGATISWFWWAWNANSGDTKGIAGPDKTWKHIQFTKVRLLTEFYGLRPWYCKAAPSACQPGAPAAVLKPVMKPAAVPKPMPKPTPKPVPKKPATLVANKPVVAAPAAPIAAPATRPFGGIEQPFVTVLNSISQAITNVGNIFGVFAVPFANPVEVHMPRVLADNTRTPEDGPAATGAAAAKTATHAASEKKAAAKVNVQHPSSGAKQQTKKAVTHAVPTHKQPHAAAAAAALPAKSSTAQQAAVLPAYATSSVRDSLPQPVAAHSSATKPSTATGKSGKKATLKHKAVGKKQLHPAAAVLRPTPARPVQPVQPQADGKPVPAAATGAAVPKAPHAAVKHTSSGSAAAWRSAGGVPVRHTKAPAAAAKPRQQQSTAASIAAVPKAKPKVTVPKKALNKAPALPGALLPVTTPAAVPAVPKSLLPAGNPGNLLSSKVPGSLGNPLGSSVGQATGLLKGVTSAGLPTSSSSIGAGGLLGGVTGGLLGGMGGLLGAAGGAVQGTGAQLPVKLPSLLGDGGGLFPAPTRRLKQHAS